MATVRKLSTSFIGTDVASLPVIPDTDPIESSGSLMLVDLTHPAGPWASGVPANGSAIPNILASRAAALTSQAASSLTASIEYTGMAGTIGLVERTAKSGLHGIITQPGGTSGTAPAAFLNIHLPAALVSYLIANSAHAYYISLWHRVTRAPGAAAQTGGNAPDILELSNKTAGATGNYLAILSDSFQNAAQQSALSGNLLAGVHRSAALLNGWKGTVPSSASDMGNWAFTVGKNSAVNGFSSNPYNLPSDIFYRLYLEDATASGRTFEQINAIDNTLYQWEMLSEGGRYYGDTFTSPATLP